MSTWEFGGLGFGVYGPEESYVVLIDDAGNESHISGHELVPADGRVGWSLYEALTGGFSKECETTVLTRETPYNTPRAYRLRIHVEAEPLSTIETAAVLSAARRAKEHK